MAWEDSTVELVSDFSAFAQRATNAVPPAPFCMPSPASQPPTQAAGGGAGTTGVAGTAGDSPVSPAASGRRLAEAKTTTAPSDGDALEDSTPISPPAAKALPSAQNPQLRTKTQTQQLQPPSRPAAQPAEANAAPSCYVLLSQLRRAAGEAASTLLPPSLQPSLQQLPTQDVCVNLAGVCTAYWDLAAAAFNTSDQALHTASRDRGLFALATLQLEAPETDTASATWETQSPVQRLKRAMSAAAAAMFSGESATALFSGSSRYAGPNGDLLLQPKNAEGRSGAPSNCSSFGGAALPHPQLQALAIAGGNSSSSRNFSAPVENATATAAALAAVELLMLQLQQQQRQLSPVSVAAVAATALGPVTSSVMAFQRAGGGGSSSGMARALLSPREGGLQQPAQPAPADALLLPLPPAAEAAPTDSCSRQGPVAAFLTLQPWGSGLPALSVEAGSLLDQGGWSAQQREALLAAAAAVAAQQLPVFADGAACCAAASGWLAAPAGAAAAASSNSSRACKVV